MTRNARRIEASVVRLRCSTCEAVFPHLVFSGENDVTTSQLCSLSSSNTNEVVAVEAEAAEWNDFEGSGAQALEQRMRLHLNRGDLRLIRLIRVEPAKSSGSAMSFQDFRNALVLTWSSLVHAAQTVRAESRMNFLSRRSQGWVGK